MSAGHEEQAASLSALVAAAQGGDRDSFGQIFDAFHLPVYRYALARLRSVADAEDVAAETFAAAFRSLGSFAWRGAPFEGWLFRIARSKIVDLQRRRARDGPMTPIASVDPALLPHTADASGEVIAREDEAAMFAAIRTLSGDQQDVLGLRFFAGLSLAETATAMGRSPNAVKQLQFRAVSSLRQRMVDK